MIPVFPALPAFPVNRPRPYLAITPWSRTFENSKHVFERCIDVLKLFSNVISKTMFCDGSPPPLPLRIYSEMSWKILFREIRENSCKVVLMKYHDIIATRNSRKCVLAKISEREPFAKFVKICSRENFSPRKYETLR